MHFPKVTLVGVGLLGGSLGLALKQRRLAARVEGYVRRDASVAECERLGVVDRATTDLASAVKDADLVVLCTPIAQMRALSEKCAPVLKAGALVTDVGSVKGVVVAELEPLFAKAGAQFVGSHPMAGAEKTGPAAARADLFEKAVCVVTPGAKTPVKAVKAMEELWASVGGRPLRLSPDQHDSLVARSSHLPHVVAAELANYVLSPAHPKEQPALCATGFRDTTRIASGSPEMWRDIALANRKHLARALGVFVEDLQEFQRALEAGDAKAMDEFFETAKHRRDQWIGNGGSPE
ncbi:MAG: prephenate dehydrogenase [Limisphaerales bacterium]